MKKNNKGFSLAELIVVVLILGILAVAVTPQIMNWVNKSKVGKDEMYAGNIATGQRADICQGNVRRTARVSALTMRPGSYIMKATCGWMQPQCRESTTLCTHTCSLLSLKRQINSGGNRYVLDDT